MPEKYRVERILGRSRLAVNAVVRHGELRQRFLLVHLRPEAPAYLEAVAGFLRGARGTLQLTGEHLVRTIDAGRMSSGAPYVALEYPTGTSLKQLQRLAGPLGITDAVDYVLQATTALAEAHALGIHHGRLGARHLFLTRRADGSPLIKVLGFGIADAICCETASEEDELAAADADPETLREPLVCMAPELLRNPREADAAADVFGLGAVLHELFTGAPVYQAASASALVAMLAADPPTPVTALRPEVPAALESIVLRCLAKDPAARFATVGDVAAALQPFGSPDAQQRVERIVKTLVRSVRPPSLSSGALVYVGPASTSVPPVSATPPASKAAPGGFSWAVLATGMALALGGAAMFGAGVATQRASASPAPLPRPVAVPAVAALTSATPAAPSAVASAAPGTVAVAPAPSWRKPGVKYTWPPKPKAEDENATPAGGAEAKPVSKVAKVQDTEALFDDTR